MVDPVRRARYAVGATFAVNGMTFANLVPRYPEIVADLGLDNAAFVRSLYESAVGRTPDVGGNTFFAAALANGGSRADIAAAIAFSDEGQQAAQPFYQTGIRVT